MPLPLMLPIAIAGGAWVAKDLVEFFRPDPQPAGTDGLFSPLRSLPPPITWALAGVTAYAGYRLVRRFIE